MLCTSRTTESHPTTASKPSKPQHKLISQPRAHRTVPGHQQVAPHTRVNFVQLSARGELVLCFCCAEAEQIHCCRGRESIPQMYQQHRNPAVHQQLITPRAETQPQPKLEVIQAQTHVCNFTHTPHHERELRRSSDTSPPHPNTQHPPSLLPTRPQSCFNKPSYFACEL